MKTIKQIADEIGVSKQAIFYRIKRPPLSNTLQSLTTNNKGSLTVSFDDEMQILKVFEGDIVKETVKSVKQKIVKEPSNTKESFDGEIIKLMKENINILQSQLKIKDKQIEELTEAVKLQAESINADRKNELAGTLIDGQKLISGDVSQKKKPWQFWRK